MPTKRSGRVGPHGFFGGRRGPDQARLKLGIPARDAWLQGARNHGGVILLPPPTILKVLAEGADT